MRELALDSIQNRIWQNEKLAPWLNRISNLAFFLGLLIELTIVILDKSAYTIQYEGQWFRVTFALFGISLITTRHSLKEWIWLFLLGILGFVSYRATGRNEILRYVVFIWACVGKDMKKALKFTFWYTAAGCGILILLSVLGIAGQVAMTEVYRIEEETRYCFGMGHPNAFHCMMLALTLLGVYCYHQKLRWWGYGGILVFHILLFFLTRSRAGFLVALGAITLLITLHYCKFLQRWAGSYILGIICIVAAVGFSVFMAKYSGRNDVLNYLDQFLTGRIRYLLYATNRGEGMVHTWSLWSGPENHYFFDLGIVRFFYWFGIIPGIVYFLAQCRLLWCSYKMRDYMLLAVVVSITIYSIFEAHYVSDYIGRNYLFFFLGMYLPQILGKKEERAVDTACGGHGD